MSSTQLPTPHIYVVLNEEAECTNTTSVYLGIHNTVVPTLSLGCEAD